jgi:hypothetical protein
MSRTALPRLTLAALIAGALFAAPALAQTGGTTSGPAAGTATTLGTGGQTPATPHQNRTVTGGGPATQNEAKGQAGGAAPVKPGLSGSESGRTPAKK